MNFSKRQWLDVQSGLNSPFGHFLKAELKLRSAQMTVDAASYVPKDQKELFDRERQFGAAAELANLINLLESTIAEKMNSAKE